MNAIIKITTAKAIFIKSFLWLSSVSISSSSRTISSSTSLHIFSISLFDNVVLTVNFSFGKSNEANDTDLLSLSVLSTFLAHSAQSIFAL